MAAPAVKPSSPPLGRKSGGLFQRRATITSILVLGVVLAPILALLVSSLSPDLEVWREQFRTALRSQVWGTILIMVGVGSGTLVIGTSLAWLVTAYRFPGSTIFSWLLALPLALPGYVLSFVSLSVVGTTGPIQQKWRSWFGDDAWFPDIRSTGGVVVVLSLVLYPYVYLLARAALKDQAGAAFQTARSLGAGPVEAARRVVIPMLRPALAAGLAIVMMETLTDFATIDRLGASSVSVGVYKFIARGDRNAANELALVVLAFALLVLLLERFLRGHARYGKAGPDTIALTPKKLKGKKALAATLACLATLILAFAAPVFQLLVWTIQELGRDRGAPLTGRFTEYALNSIVLAAGTAIITVLVAWLFTNTNRFEPSRASKAISRLATIGYSLPGPVIAIGVLTVLVAFDQTLRSTNVGAAEDLILTGSVLGVVYGCSVRYLGPGFNAIEGGLTQVGQQLTDSARSLGASRWTISRKVHIPLCRSSLLTAVVLVVVDTVKDLPIVLLLRPIGFDTLSVWVWNLTSESRYSQAALPALALTSVAAIPVVVLSRKLAREV